MKSCYGNFIGTTENIMLWEIMLWKNHVRRGLAVIARSFFLQNMVLVFLTFLVLNSSCPRNLRHFGNGQKKCAHIYEVLVTFL